MLAPQVTPAVLDREEPVAAGVSAWAVFAISFALLLSDYMSRQVLAAIFPLLKVDWALSDGALGALGGVVALVVGLLTFPVSLLADRFGRVRSVVAMAAIWSLATLGCALASNYHQMLLARLFVGVGEAAYGSVGLAVVFTFFPRSLRATITGAFMAGGVFGSFLGLAIGGAVAAQFGWRWAFGGMALAGLVLAAVYPLITRLPATQEPADGGAPVTWSIKAIASDLFGVPAVRFAYIASGLQLFVMGAMTAWLVSYFDRDFGLDPARAAVVGASFLLLAGIGMIACGIAADRISRGSSRRSAALAAAYGLAAALPLICAFRMQPGAAQLALLGLGLFFAAGSSGPAGAIVADGAPPQRHAAALATLTLANNLLGLAPGAALTGLLADRIGLTQSLAMAPFAALAASACFWCARRAASVRSSTGKQ